MALDQTENFVRQNVTSSIGVGDTTINVADASDFPDPSSGNYNCVLWDTAQGRPDEDANVEIVRVTGRDTGADTLTVTRAQEGTSDVSHPSSSALILSPTAKMFSDIQTRTSGFSDDGNTLDIDELDTGDKEGVSQSVQAALSNGKIVGVASGIADPIKVLDPTTAASDDAAIQAVNDWIEDGGNRRSGRIYVPHIGPDGNPITIENQVVIGDPDDTENARISIEFWPQGNMENGQITTTITDGTHMFLLAGHSQGATGLYTTEFLHGDFDLGNNNAGLVKVTDSVRFRIWPSKVRKFTGDGVTIDGGCFNWSISGEIDANNSTGRNIVMANTTTNGPPGDGRILPSTVCTGNSQACIDVDHTSDAPPVFVGGHMEGGDGTAGTASLNLTDGDWVITPLCKVGGGANGGHGVNFEGRRFFCMAGSINNVGGDALRIDDPVQAVVYPFAYGGITGGDIINVVNEPSESGGYLILPYESQILESGDSVTYPSPAWTNTFYHDGWQKLRTFTDQTVAAGSTAIPTSFAGRVDTQVKAEVFPDSAPSAETEWSWRWGIGSSGQMDLILEEHAGNTSIDLGGVVYRRGQGTNLR